MHGKLTKYMIQKAWKSQLNCFTSFVIIAFFALMLVFFSKVKRTTVAFYFLLCFTSCWRAFCPSFVLSNHSSTPSNQSEVFPEFSDWHFLRWAKEWRYFFFRPATDCVVYENVKSKIYIKYKIWNIYSKEIKLNIKKINASYTWLVQSNIALVLA